MRRPVKVKVRNLSAPSGRAVLSAAPAARRLAQARVVSGESWVSPPLRGRVSARVRAGLVLRRVIRSAATPAAFSHHGARNR